MKNLLLGLRGLKNSFCDEISDPPPLFEKKNIFKQHFEDEGFPKHVIKGIVLVYLYYNIQQTQGLASNLKEADLANRFLYIYTRQPRDRSVPTFPARGGPPRIYGGAASCASLSETALGSEQANEPSA